MSEYIYPTMARSVSDSFADHVARGSVNPGTDYICGVGTPVVAVKAGRIMTADSTTSGSGGRLIYIDHGDGTRTDYLHLSRIDVTTGQHVDQGEQIGLSGASAWDSERGVGPHLHISLHVNGRNVDFDAIMHAGGAGAGGTDPDVVRAQQMLNALDYGLEVDGVHGPATDAAVRDFQTKHGLTVDGLIGPATLDALAHNQPAPGSTKPVLSVGSTGQLVSELQAFLNRVYPAYSSLVVDGDFGPATEAVVKEFQRRSGITADGIVGPVTWSHLGM